MVKMLYITGMIFFAVLIGDSAHRLHHSYEIGTLFEPYNSESKEAVTLLAVSSCGLAVLCFLELMRIRRRFRPPIGSPLKRGFQNKPVDAGGISTNIYSAPREIDEWEERLPRIGASRTRRQPWYEISGLWMSLLRIYCGVLPVVYTYTLINYLFLWIPSGADTLVLSVLFPLLFLGSVFTSFGILRKKAWGVKVGYAVAVFHLLLFPLGTAAGFVMLIALMGSTSDFEVTHRRRLNRRVRHRKVQSAAL